MPVTFYHFNYVHFSKQARRVKIEEKVNREIAIYKKQNKNYT